MISTTIQLYLQYFEIHENSRPVRTQAKFELFGLCVRETRTT